MSMQIERPGRTAGHAPETGPADGPVVVAGYDGSDESRHALALAAERAAPFGIVVAVHVTTPVSDWLGTPYYERSLDAVRRRGEQMLDEMNDIDLGCAIMEVEMVEGSPAEALLRVAKARGAREIVIGSRGLGRFRAVLGSVSHELLEKADRPVVIVPRLAVQDDRAA